MNKFTLIVVALAVGTVSGCAEMTETQRTTGTGRRSVPPPARWSVD
nr:hypothetical protein [Dechloromonas sp. A34]